MKACKLSTDLSAANLTRAYKVLLDYKAFAVNQCRVVHGLRQEIKVYNTYKPPTQKND
jgi:hypothetical protein